ncbi:MAG: thioredoxin domain-containing protein, partial [Dehalococcoidia bacterium]|nr:thioredoxin domain-containing protein [Dehalococcoidia bacterium]
SQGGIYDHLGGGFARYTVDETWLVPHFEKMLYDNAQLVSLYLHAYQATGNPLFKRIIEETLEYVSREMTHPAGGFYSASDADSEGVEGKFFAWTRSEIRSALNDADAALACSYWGVTEEGNFEGSNVLNVPVTPQEFAAGSGRDLTGLMDDISRIRQVLFNARSERVPPGIDDKVLTSWNALMLKAYAKAGTVLENKAWIAIAEKNARLLLDRVRDDEGRLLHTWKATGDSSEAPPNSTPTEPPGERDSTQGEARILGYLDDHACLVDALLTLYEATFDYSYVDSA